MFKHNNESYYFNFSSADQKSTAVNKTKSDQGRKKNKNHIVDNNNYDSHESFNDDNDNDDDDDNNQFVKTKKLDKQVKSRKGKVIEKKKKPIKKKIKNVKIYIY